MLFLLFAVYNLAQYWVINEWMKKQELVSMQKNMVELQDYFQEKRLALEPGNVTNTQKFLDNFNQSNQVIRILDAAGTPIITAADHLDSEWVSPKSVEHMETLNIWHLEEHLLVMRSPLVTPDFKGTLEIFNNLETFEQLSKLTLWVMLIGGAAAVLLSGLGGLVLARKLLQPVQMLAETIKNVKQKGMHERVRKVGNEDELSNLASLFNELMDQLEASFRQQKQFVEDASHELKTPISIIEGHLRLLNRWGKQEPMIVDESLTASLQEVERLKGIVQELLQLTRSEVSIPESDLEIFHMYEVIAGIVKSFSVLHPDFEFRTELEEIKSISIQMLPFHLEQTMLILLDNAVNYSLEPRNILLIGTQRGNGVQLQVIDQGIGIPESDLPHVFDRFYRVDKSRNREQGGTGLGLSIAKRIVESYGGEISISSKENQGTTVAIWFPTA
ncbi:HAMP domain-containing histidine kinase [Paenibacillus periandrae]|uniref:HAMP domain-containing histidine kinase n=1 Tax=Paenibacillus periandrae TaxID=1761741 RepID=UPI001F08AEEC|nr:HAMP domain-containing histidine kinase [Paenibacillus periandrae]